ncbi:DUF3618 domain-containing protein [Pseudonocardia parietis]|uniref:ElaB/YqjD/DUF883 family membrane-anchored ribosome-binding protein n=1 Tax=Pseudonocardia parietis TaxID=570936 RepID=A0ABS4VV10_9PSEU|nr:DUF3618 domain-containing protein [Pseudonocardia parietis]MBP2367755.1 ElaB/YqjD/DUF883 family membrane-anchored ribosome-binding protein [Pseudonocardia parietis]
MTTPHSTPPHGTPHPVPHPAAPDDPEAIRRDIARIQRQLSGDVDALTEKVTPGRIVERRVDRARGRLAGWRDAVMGSDTADHVRHAGRTAHSLADEGADRVEDVAGTVADRASDAASTVSGTARAAPRAARRQTRGNPLAAGLIAFGAGWLASSVLPASRREQELAGQAEEKALEVGRPLARQAGEKAEELGGALRNPAEQAARAVQETAQQAASNVRAEGHSAAEEVRDRAEDAGRNVQDEARNG